MALRPLGARALTSVAAFGLLCALGAASTSRDAAGASRDAVGAAARGTPKAAASAFANSNEACKCKVPERYRFRISGTTDYRYGGTETWAMRGKLKRRRRGVSFLKADYWQVRGTVTLTFRDIVIDTVDSCSDGGPATVNAPTQTLPLRRNGTDVGFTFRLARRKYTVVTGPPENPNRGAWGTLRCSDGATQPILMQHKWTGFVTRRGRPLRVVKGSFAYTSFDLERYRARWRLTAID